MCGIAGIINPPGKAVAALDIQMMSTAMEHRGPDDLGFLGWREGGSVRIEREALRAVDAAQLAVAHRRLSIIDEGAGGWQPMATADGRFAITFVSASDTEVLLAALSHWGVEKTLPKLTGMFAFAVLDTRARTVTLARDPFGIEPLSYACVKGGLAFASELTGLLMLAGVGRVVESSALYDYLRFGFTDRGERTLFAVIKHLPPAHFAVVDLDHPQVVCPQRNWTV